MPPEPAPPAATANALPAGPTTRPQVNALHPGDRVEVVHEVKVGQQRWHARTVGTVERIERRRHGLHFQRQFDDKVFSDLLVLRLDDGSLTTVTLDEFTELRRL
ncbi:MAG: hypothetical protein K6T86_15455 [Pirellulales bacterium]|nr:hypothetical protein [Pirellulales bacterium]